MMELSQDLKASSVWNVTGSFGKLNSDIQIRKKTFSTEFNGVFVSSERKQYKNGVVCQVGYLKNNTDEVMTVNTLASRFVFDGGEYDIYTQSNFWQNESRGGWSELVSQISVEGKSIRNCAEAIPFMVVWNKQTGRGMAFHAVAYSTWRMKVTRLRSKNETSVTEVEIGVNPEGFSKKINPDEKIQFPEIIYYEVKNKTDMDAYKLHDYMNDFYPRREMPVIYNTWLYKFDRINCENVLAQLSKAKELGVEYFVIDAGWFGDGADWSECRGDYEENLTFGFCGRMKEIAEKVHEYGMKFGFWIEIECASYTANIVKTHPELFIKGDTSYFLDFSKEESRDYIFKKIVYFTERFKADFIKFDFNADITFDSTNTAFYDYFDGYRILIKQIKDKYPNLYMENCASGGMRMGIRDGKIYDSFWLSDNQSPREGIRIFKDTLKRMPPQWIECWAVIRSVENFAPVYGSDDYSEKLIAADDGTISNVSGVNMDYLKAFLTGNPIGMSCDLNLLSDKASSEIKEFVENFKEEREFWISANCRILTDTETMSVLQFSNVDLTKMKIVVVSEKSIQKNIRVYPVVNADLKYKVDGNVFWGTVLMEEGFDVPIDSRYSGKTVDMEVYEEV